MNIARRLGCRVLGLTLPTAGFAQHIASCSTRRRGGLCPPFVCARFSRARFPLDGEEKINGPLLGVWSFFLLILVTALLVSTWIYVRRGHRHSGQRPSRSAAYFSSRGIHIIHIRRGHRYSLGWGDGVGHCHDVANLPGKCLFISLFFGRRGKQALLFFKGMVSYFVVLLSMQVAKRGAHPMLP